MGVEKRMDNKNRKVKLYTQQSDNIVNQLKSNGYHIAKMKFIKEKYGEVAPVFVEAYNWYVSNAEKIVPRSNDEESAIWAFREIKNIENHSGHKILEIHVPIEKSVFFKMEDWNKRINLSYIGKTLEEEKSFNKKILKYGINYSGDVISTPFYPQLKDELIKSWENLFRYDNEVKELGDMQFSDMQAGIWRLEWDWVKKIL